MLITSTAIFSEASSVNFPPMVGRPLMCLSKGAETGGGRDGSGAGIGEVAVMSITLTAIGTLISDVRMAVETKKVDLTK
jgi:hypothetical protein